jgi:hypothetical protein
VGGVFLCLCLVVTDTAWFWQVFFCSSSSGSRATAVFSFLFYGACSVIRGVNIEILSVESDIIVVPTNSRTHTTRSYYIRESVCDKVPLFPQVISPKLECHHSQKKINHRVLHEVVVWWCGGLLM